MKKRPHLLLVLALCACLAAGANAAPGKQPEQVGMAVWGDALGIHTADTLLARGDLFLFKAHVQGVGALLLADTATRHIVAQGSSLPHLIINNTDTVTLRGSLHLRCGLTLVQGVFDTRAVDFSLADSAFVHLLPGGTWLHTESPSLHWLPILPLTPPTAQPAWHLGLLPPSLYSASRPLVWRRAALPVYTASLPLAVCMRILYPPPQLQVPVRYAVA
jgi:hypothetical protein